jgi:hypothetical protein
LKEENKEMRQKWVKGIEKDRKELERIKKSDYSAPINIGSWV